MTAPKDQSATEHRVPFAEAFAAEMEEIGIRRTTAAHAEPAPGAGGFEKDVWVEVLSQARARVLAEESAALEACRAAAGGRDPGQGLPPDVDERLQRVANRFVREAWEASLRRACRDEAALAAGGGAGDGGRVHALEALWRSTLAGPLEKALAVAFRQACSAPDGASPWDDACAEAEARVLEEAAEQAVRQAALGMDLVGLAFSGGGIRSATFNLGILQGLADCRLLRLFDYLSTVSGGGYIGGWLAAWVKRAGSLDRVEQQLRPSRVAQAQGRTDRPLLPVDAEPEPVYHLRSYSSYLAPRRGVFSADSWVLATIYLRNIFLNQLILLPFCMVLLLAPRLLIPFYWWWDQAWDDTVLLAILAALLVALFSIGVSIHLMTAVRQRRPLKAVRVQTGGGWVRALIRWPLGVCARLVNGLVNWLRLARIQTGIQVLHVLILFPLFVFALLVSCQLSWDFFYNYEGAPPRWKQTLEKYLPWDLPPGLSTHLGWIVLLGSWGGAVTGGIYLVQALLFRWWRPFWAFCLKLVFAALSGFAALSLYYALFGVALDQVYGRDWDVPFMAAAGAPLVLLVIVLGAYVMVGLFGKDMPDDVREWWSSLCGWLLMYAAGWAAVAGIALFGPPLLIAAGGWAQAALGSAWVTTAVGGILAGKSTRTSSGQGNRLLEWVARIAPPAFVAGLLLLVSLLAATALDNWPDPCNLALYFKRLNEITWRPVTCWIAGCLALAVFMAWRVDVNLFSLHGTYANRLVRCYLGASRPKDRNLDMRDRLGGAPVPVTGPLRRPNPITGFDPNDDLPLVRLRRGTGTPTPAADGPPDPPYTGPFPLINTAMNLVGGDELAWQERKAESFVLTPLYCGSLSTRYRRLPESDDKALLLGTAVTLSGAAVSPNMGYHSSPAVTALLTVFNVRLGGWVANPRHGVLRNTGPWEGLLYLGKELFGRTNARGDYVYLSDGGHFDNLGVYELVHRRCRYIVACDAGADPAGAFADLGDVVRKCRTDFGVRIHIDVSPLQRQANGSFSRWHCAIGKIRYSDVDPGAADGVLVYIKSSLTGDEPSDVLQFRAHDPRFPHNPTADQFFNESKFESYRALGYHIAQRVFGAAVKETGRVEEAPLRAVADTLFQKLRQHWYPPPPRVDETFLRSTKEYIQLHEILRADSNLRDLSREIYGPLDGAVRTGDDKLIAQLHVVSRMLQIMEDVWVSLKLDDYHDYPLYKGWFEVFRRWMRSDTFRRHWATLKAEYSEGFAAFCDRLLDQHADEGT